MYLGESLSGLDGQVHEMCGVIPYRTRLTGRLSLGYRDAQALADSPLMVAGQQIRGHEFHDSALCHAPSQPAYRWAAGTFWPVTCTCTTAAFPLWPSGWWPSAGRKAHRLA